MAVKPAIKPLVSGRTYTIRDLYCLCYGYCRDELSTHIGRYLFALSACNAIQIEGLNVFELLGKVI